MITKKPVAPASKKAAVAAAPPKPAGKLVVVHFECEVDPTTDLPLLGDANSPGKLIDQAGQVKKAAKKLKGLETYFVEAIKARWPKDDKGTPLKTFGGEKYEGKLTHVATAKMSQERVTALIALLDTVLTEEQKATLGDALNVYTDGGYFMLKVDLKDD
jgi:hypothetical protein